MKKSVLIILVFYFSLMDVGKAKSIKLMSYYNH